VNRIARWTGATWQTMGSGMNPGGSVPGDVQESTGGRRAFTSAGGASRNTLPSGRHELGVAGRRPQRAGFMRRAAYKDDLIVRDFIQPAASAATESPLERDRLGLRWERHGPDRFRAGRDRRSTLWRGRLHQRGGGPGCTWRPGMDGLAARGRRDEWEVRGPGVTWGSTDRRRRVHRFRRHACKYITRWSGLLAGLWRGHGLQRVRADRYEHTLWPPGHSRLPAPKCNNIAMWDGSSWQALRAGLDGKHGQWPPTAAAWWSAASPHGGRRLLRVLAWWEPAVTIDQPTAGSQSLTPGDP